MAKRSQNDLPEHMKVLGKEHSNEYQSYLNHIENLFHYDLYGPRFYGFLDVNNQKTDVESEPNATRSILQVINHLIIKRWWSVINVLVNNKVVTCNINVNICAQINT